MAKFAIDDIDDDLRTSLKVFFGFFSQIVLGDHGLLVPVFFFKLTLSKCKKTHRISEIFSHQCQGHALVSVKVNGLPVHF